MLWFLNYPALNVVIAWKAYTRHVEKLFWNLECAYFSYPTGYLNFPVGIYSLTNLLISSLFLGILRDMESNFFFLQPLLEGLEFSIWIYIPLWRNAQCDLLGCPFSDVIVMQMGIAPFLCHLIASWFGNGWGVAHTFPGAFVKSSIYCFCKLKCTIHDVSHFGFTYQVFWRPDVPQWHAASRRTQGAFVSSLHRN